MSICSLSISYRYMYISINFDIIDWHNYFILACLYLLIQIILHSEHDGSVDIHDGIGGRAEHKIHNPSKSGNGLKSQGKPRKIPTNAEHGLCLKIRQGLYVRGVLQSDYVHLRLHEFYQRFYLRLMDPISEVNLD